MHKPYPIYLFIYLSSIYLFIYWIDILCVFLTTCVFADAEI